MNTSTVRAAAPLVNPKLLARHQIAALLGTGADFLTMIALVEIAHASPPVATIFSAMIGGITNFTLARVWAFRDRHNGSMKSQAIRYAAASLTGALINAALLALFLSITTLIPYPVARGIVAVAVSILYTYPVHTRFVFRVEKGAAPQ
jgi:putative flippase GtrA